MQARKEKFHIFHKKSDISDWVGFKKVKLQFERFLDNCGQNLDVEWVVWAVDASLSCGFGWFSTVWLFLGKIGEVFERSERFERSRLKTSQATRFSAVFEQDLDFGGQVFIGAKWKSKSHKKLKIWVFDWVF